MTLLPLVPRTRTELAPAARALAGLLPGVYLSRDEAQPGHPLYLLLEVLGAPLAELERAIDALRDDHFVERADPAALPLLAELVGATLLGDDPGTNRGVVARTVHWRRRKGTLGTLAEVLRVTSGWDADIDEAFRSLLSTQDLAFPTRWRGRDAVLTDPVALADPLSRRTPLGTGEPDADRLLRLPGETMAQALRRLGRADAGRPAASPRSVDLLGWARPEHAVVRTARLVHAELERVQIGEVRAVGRLGRPGVTDAAFHLDPGGRDIPLLGVWPQDEPAPALTASHEPESGPQAPAGYRHGMLTPTALAHDPDTAERSGCLSVFVDDVRLVGADPVPGSADPLAVRPIGPEPLLRFADAQRPGPGDEWTLHLLAVDDPDALHPTDLPAGDPGAANPALLRVTARRGERDPEVLFPAGQVPRAGAVAALRLSRAGVQYGHRRATDATWRRFLLGERPFTPVSSVTSVDAGGTRLVLRLDRRAGGGLGLAVWRPGSPASRWTSRPLPLAALSDVDRPDSSAGLGDGPALAAVGMPDGSVLFTAPVGDSLGVWRIPDPLAGSLSVQRLDTAAGRRPTARVAVAACALGDRLVIFGGRRGEHVLGELWSVGTDGAWRAHLVRGRRARTGAVLLPAGDSALILLGGASVLGELDVTACRAELSDPRPAWAPLPAPPLPAHRPGVLWARASGNPVTLDVLAWVDRTAPVPLRYTGGAWTAGAAEPDAPNPPADGDALFLPDGEFAVTGPPPLPASEVILRLGGQGRVAFLPAVDLAESAGAEVFTVHEDAATVRHYEPGDPMLPSLRLGAGRAAPTDRRDTSAARLGVPGRLAWTPLRLRQVNLAAWDDPLALDLTDRVGLDPRLGRVLVPGALAAGRFTASYLVGRAEACGAGFAGPLPAAWLDPGQDAPAATTGTDAWVSPARAGVPGGDGLPVHADLAAGIQAGGDAGADTVRLGVLGSPRLPAQALTLGQAGALAVRAADTGGLPYVLAADGVSLRLHERVAAGEDPDAGPSWAFTGVATDGAIQLAAAAGVLQLRWCTLAGPGALALDVAGAGHAPPVLRQRLPEPTVRLRLYGCRLGRVTLPPWASLRAAGCTFDAGTDDGVAIAAAGADVRLRHCTVRGGVRAGRLAASSSVLRGDIVCDLPEDGWLRYTVATATGRPPRAYRGQTLAVSFAALDDADPRYLALAPNNPAATHTAAEHGRTPGAYPGIARRGRELTERTAEFLPLALIGHQVDAAAADLEHMR